MSYILDVRADLTDDRRIGRCYANVMEIPDLPEGDERPSDERRVFALELNIIRRRTDGTKLTKKEAVAEALAQAAIWLRKNITALDEGKEYHITITAEGARSSSSTPLPD